MLDLMRQHAKNWMMKAILGPAYAKADESTYHKVLNRVGKFIDSTTGIQTLVQMQGLVKLVREFGFIPEKEVLDEFGYKEIYNAALLNELNGQEIKIAGITVPKEVVPSDSDKSKKQMDEIMLPLMGLTLKPGKEREFNNLV